MKPSPDDHHEIEPPKTRAHFATDVDPAARPNGAEADRTLDDDTKRMAKSAALSESGMGSNPGSLGAATGGTMPRGVTGKIEPNQTLYAKYHVVKKLGSGAMGDVWLVRHASMGDLPALKLIVSNIASNEVALRRFQREFKVMASLKHPHAVTSTTPPSTTTAATSTWSTSGARRSTICSWRPGRAPTSTRPPP